MGFSEIRRRPAGASLDLGGLHPVLRRVYAARGVSRSEELDLSLERLLPVSSLEGVEAAVRLLSMHRQGRVLVVGDFDEQRAGGACLALDEICARRFSGAQSIPFRLRFDA